MWKKFFAKLPFFKRLSNRILKRPPRLYIRPSKAGLCLFFFIVAEILMSAIYSSASLQLLGFFLLGLYSLAMTWTHAELRGLQVLSLRIRDGASKSSSVVDLRIESTWDLERTAVVLTVRMQGEPIDSIWNFTVPLTKIRGKGLFSQTHDLNLNTSRGRWVSQRITLSSQAPFGLFIVWARLKIHAVEALIYPQPISSLPTLNQGIRKGRTQPRLGDDDFAQLRESHHIESSARVAARPAREVSMLLIKEFEAELGDDSKLDWQSLTGEFETRLSICAGALLHRPGRYEISTPFYSGFVETKSEKEQALRKWAVARESR